MSKGDVQRVWFPEMIERLRSAWQPGISFAALIQLCDELDAMLQRIRTEQNIPRPIVKCPRCGHISPGAEPHVTVRAMILSLNRFGIAPAEPVHSLEKNWAAYRKQQTLDLYGKIPTPESSAAAQCKRCAAIY